MPKKTKNHVATIIIILIIIIIVTFPWSLILSVIGLIIGLIIRRNRKIKNRNEEIYAELERQRLNKAITLSQVDSMNGIDFEHYVSMLLQSKGFNSTVTKGSNDYGVDIVAFSGDSKYAIQVKRYENNVSRKAVSDAVAGIRIYECNKAMVVTNSFFTKGAIELANSNSCVLIDRTELSNWIYEFQTSDN